MVADLIAKSERKCTESKVFVSRIGMCKREKGGDDQSVWECFAEAQRPLMQLFASVPFLLPSVSD